MLGMNLKHLALVILLAAATAIAQELPKPELRLLGVTNTAENGAIKVLYEIEVVNRYEFDDNLFMPAPALPPCGKNGNSSRTWINVYSERRGRIYGWCGVYANSELASLKFIVPGSWPQPKKLFIDLVDRAEGKTVRSNTIRIE